MPRSNDSLPLTLNEKFMLPYIVDLVNFKLTGKEKSRLTAADLEFHRGEFVRLREQLDQAGLDSHLPEEPTARSGLNDLLIRMRLKAQ